MKSQYACELKVVMGLLWERVSNLIVTWSLHAPSLPLFTPLYVATPAVQDYSYE